jgi:hypothetical protein
LNANSIRPRFDEICSLLSALTISLFAITESKLDPERDSISQFQISGYNSIRQDRICKSKKSGGGIIVHIHDSFSFEQLDFHSSCKPPLTEILIIKLYKTNCRPIVVCTIYNNPESCKSQFIEFFKELNLFLYSLSFEKIIQGDLNINLLSNLDSFNLNAHKLFLACKEFNLWQLMKGPTCNGVSLLDHVFVSDKINYPFSAHFPFAGSDHDLCIVARKINNVKPRPRYISARNLRSVDWDIFQDNILKFQFANELNQDLSNSEFWRFNNFVLSELDKVAPLKCRRVKGLINPWFTSNIKYLCHVRDNAKKIAVRSNSLDDWKLYRKARNEASTHLSKAKKAYFFKKFQDKVSSQCLWDTVNELTGFRKRGKRGKRNKTPVTVLEHNSTSIGDSVRINDLFADEFIVIPKNPPDYKSISYSVLNYSSDFVFNDGSKAFENLVASQSDIDSVISSIKDSKGGDPLHVPMNIIKNCKKAFSSLLSVFFTSILVSCAIPLAFKSATVLPLYKGKGTRRHASNYRPIVLLNAFCKIFERFLFHRVYDRVSSQLITEQHAYRKGKSCHAALSIFTQYVFDKLDLKKNKVGAIFVDLKKAFDTISHEKLTLKLMNNFHLEPSFVNILFNNSAGRLFKFSNSPSKDYSTYAGVGQGSALGPLIFSMYINDIASAINVPFILYADDLILFTDGTDCNDILNKLELCFSNVCSWCDENDMLVNFGKTKLMFFHKEKDPIVGEVRACTVRGNMIERVFEFKYLGLLLDPHLNFNLHFEYVSSKVASRIKYILGVKRYLSCQAMCNMLNAYVHSLTDYCIDIWTVQGDTRLNLIQNKIDRFLINYFFPTIVKKSTRKRTYRSVRDSIDINQLRDVCNFLTLKERSDFVLLKNLFKCHALCPLVFTLRSSTRCMPQLPVTRHNTAFYERSLEFRSRKLWNALPKEWVLNDMSYPGFCVKVKNWIISHRYNDFV